MSFEYCRFCEPPVRHPGCQSHCPYYAADKANRAGDDFRTVRSFKQKRLKNLK